MKEHQKNKQGFVSSFLEKVSSGFSVLIGKSKADKQSRQRQLKQLENRKKMMTDVMMGYKNIMKKQEPYLIDNQKQLLSPLNKQKKAFNGITCCQNSQKQESNNKNSQQKYHEVTELTKQQQSQLIRQQRQKYQNKKIKQCKQSFRSLLKKFKIISQIFQGKDLSLRTSIKYKNIQKQLTKLGAKFLQTNIKYSQIHEIKQNISQIQIQFFILQSQSNNIKDAQQKYQKTLQQLQHYKSIAEEQRRKLQSIEKQKQELQEQTLCIICTSQKKNCMNTNCKHICCCQKCIVQLDACPLCRAQIKQYEKVYQ